MRPSYHYAPAANWLSDPNGLVHFSGEWHLFYQYNPQGEDWGHMSWGHAVSRDLAHWDELPPALLEDEQHLIFSGSAVVDHQGTAGLGHDAMVALYTGAALGAAAHQSQCLAWSNDLGRSWQKLAENPVLDIGMADFRDPNVFWHAPSGQWIMVVVLSAENRALIYGSRDLLSWHELSAITGAGAPGDIWECPLLIELPVEGGGTHWLFKVDVLSGAPGSGALYQTGSFDGTSFTPDAEGLWLVVDAGSDFYAAIAWHEPRDEAGRPVWIGWIGNHAYQGRLPVQGWRGAMSVPRRISLRWEGAGLRLVQQLEPASIAGVALAGLDQTEIAIASRLALPDGVFVLHLADALGRMLTIEQDATLLRVTRLDPASPFLDAFREVQLPAGHGLELWLDAGSIEIVGEGGALSLTMQHRMAGERLLLGWNKCQAGQPCAA